MMECRDTGLPMNEPLVFKAFCAWRLNAADFAKDAHLDENYPVRLAQVINSANGSDTSLMALAMLMSVPAPAWSVMEKRFGKEMVDKMEEAGKHRRTGYTYVDQASDEVKGLAMAEAILSFDKFIKAAADVDDTLMAGEMGRDAEDVVHDLTMPECRMHEQAAQKLSGTKYTALEQLCAEKLAEYKYARKEHFAALADRDMAFANEADDEKARQVPFEMQGLLDAPPVRKAYEILAHDGRVGLPGLANALALGRLLTELPGPKDAAVISAGMISAGIQHLTPEDKEFLPGKLGFPAVKILKTYDIRDAYLQSAESLVAAPVAVRQLAVANGAVALSWARQECENILEYIDNRPGTLAGNERARLKMETLAPVYMLQKAVTGALLPMIGKTESPQLEQIFIDETKQVKQFIAAHMPEEQKPVAARHKPSGRNFGI